MALIGVNVGGGGGGKGDGGEGGEGNLPLAILLLGAAAICAFLAMRPWPQSAGAPIKPGAYLVDVIEGNPPPAGPPQFSEGDVDLTAAGLGALIGIWTASKAANALSKLTGGGGGASESTSQAESDVDNIGSELGTAAEDAG